MRLKRWIYGQPLLAGYRAMRSSSLARAYRQHPLGFRFAGTENFFREDWEAEQRRIIGRELENAEIFIDVGANQGIYSCLAASLGKIVVAVEPEPGNLEFLLANVATNEFDIEVFPLAASAKPGRGTIFGDAETASLVDRWFGNAPSFAQRIACNSLDNLFADRWPGRRKLIKIDVEGFEGQALEGAVRLIRSSPSPTWLIESGPQMLGGEPRSNAGFPRVFQLMFDADYSAHRIDTGAPVEAVDVAAMIADPASAGLGYFLFRKSA